MRILNICAYTWEIGGPARIIYDHTTEVLRQGHQVDILSPMTPGDEMYPAPEGARLFPVARTTPVSNVYREFSLEMYRFLRHHIHEYDVIHMHGIWHFGSLVPFLIPNNAVKVITIHGLLDKWAVAHHKWKKDIVTLLYQKRILGKADLIQINNTDEEGDVVRYLGYRPKNMVIVPNGMKLSEYSNLPAKGSFRAKHQVRENEQVVLFMGRLNIKKGLDLLLPAFKKIEKQLPNATLFLAGGDDGYQQETEDFIRKNNLQNRIKLVGLLTDTAKKEALADADVFVLPSYSEGFSIAVLEAMTSKVPTIVSDRVGFGDYIKRYDAAFLTPLTSDGVAKGLLKILQDKTYAQDLANRAYKMVTENFDIRKVANQLLEEYKNVKKK
ncbi:MULTISPECIES: glycosyltransferase [Dyadobacter]|jgi:glycosyltransferase involved in cell wall biosynthesis|uniref:Glycosyltransferase n=1 Tax=Dyadobacter chenhuakuii TaxID=2909339 RepID=A0ABY4XSH9_9BACT|nr:MULTISPECIES: glycosyltransferase [Dyadobacter]MCF2492651.1 glycosyltransferase [Dyadobacter chenhuakuii]MCF2520714.1 glycosyltransferase [Dyadobacter sp. CY351]USJ33056.1 glycosyltransferase [Dyadobacter chenhuakuii]